MFRIALQSAIGRRRRFFATLVAVALSVSFMSGALIFSDTLKATIDDLFTTVFQGTDVRVRSSQTVESFFDEQRATLDESLVDVVEAVDGVAEVSADLDGKFALIIGSDGEPVHQAANGAPTFMFAWTDSETLNPTRIDEGRAPDGPDEVVINKGAADKGKLKVGDRVTIITGDEPRDFELVGIISFNGNPALGGSTAAVFDLATAQELAGQPGRLDAISVAAEEGVPQEVLRERIAAALASEEVEVITGEQAIADQQEQVAPFLDGFRTFLLVFAGVTLFVGAFIIYNTFTILLTQRTRELALLRAIGARRRQVMGMVMGEALAVGAFASAAGVVLGMGTASLIRGLLKSLGLDLPERSLVLTGGTVAATVVTGIIVTLVSALMPAVKAARVSPLAAMREVSVDRSGRSRIRFGIGILVTAAGASALLYGLYAAERNEGLIIGVGAAATFLGVVVLGPVIAPPFCRVIGLPLKNRDIAGELAVHNAIRNPRRTAGTAAALMIGVGLVSLITVFAESVRYTINDEVRSRFKGDLVIDSGSFGFGGLPPALASEVAELPEVDAAAPIRFTLVEIAGSGEMAIGIDPEQMSRIFDLSVAEGDLADLQPGEIAVSLSAKRFHGWRLGDTIEVGFAETGAQEFTIAAITDGAGASPTGDEDIEFTLNNADIDANMPRPFDILVYVRLAEGVDSQSGLAAVESVTEEYPNAEVLDVGAFASRQSSQVNQFLGLIFGLLALAIVVALIGIANTLSLSIVERKREIGLLRAVGMTRRQLRRAVRGEAVLIAFLGTLLGLGIGIFFGVSLVVSLSDDGLGLRIPIGQLMVIAGLGALAGVLSSIVPARRVGRLDVLSSIVED